MPSWIAWALRLKITFYRPGHKNILHTVTAILSTLCGIECNRGIIDSKLSNILTESYFNPNKKNFQLFYENNR